VEYGQSALDLARQLYDESHPQVYIYFFFSFLKHCPICTPQCAQLVAISSDLAMIFEELGEVQQAQAQARLAGYSGEYNLYSDNPYY
jgi:hypothetical protein